MKFIQEFFEGCRVSGIYLCKHKQAAVTKNGKPYENVILQDKTGTIDAKIWDPNSLGIDEFDSLDYIEIMGDVTNFAGALQLNIKRARKAREGEYDPTDYLPVSKCDIDEMYGELMAIIKTIPKSIPVPSVRTCFLWRMKHSSNASASIPQPRQYTTVLWADCWSIR